MNNISIKTSDNVEHVMSVETYARWLCLMEAIDVIDRTAEKNNIDLNKRTDWVKPLAIQKYIDERFPGMLHDVKVEEHLDVETFDVLQAIKSTKQTTRLDDASLLF